MRVLQLSLDYAPFWHRGGPPRIMYSYAQGLIQKNVKIKCICSSHGDKAFSGKTEILDGSEVVYLKELEQSFLKRFYLNFSPFKIWYEIKVFYKPNLIIHLSQTRSIFNIMALIFSYFYKVNIVFSPFGSLPNRGSLVLKIFDFFVTNQLVKRASLNLGQTVHELDVLVGFGATKTSLLLAPLCYEGIVCPSEDTRDRIRNEMGCGVSTRVILFLGRFHKTKGVVDLIESFSLSSRKKSDAQLWLVVLMMVI